MIWDESLYEGVMMGYKADIEDIIEWFIKNDRGLKWRSGIDLKEQ